MRNESLILRKYIELDMLFFIIKTNPEISKDALLEKLKDNYPIQSVSITSVSELLKKLIKDKHIFANENEQFIVSPISKNFPGYAIEELQNSHVVEKKERIERYLKIGAFITTIVSVIVSSFFSLQNLRLNKENNEKAKIIQGLQLQIDKLQKHINNTR